MVPDPVLEVVTTDLELEIDLSAETVEVIDDDINLVHLSQQDDTLVIEGVPGPEGPPGPPGGPPGPPGPPGPVAMYVHVQTVPSASWFVDYGLGVRRMPTVFSDEFPDEPIWTTVKFLNDDQCIIEWPQPTTGRAEF